MRPNPVWAELVQLVPVVSLAFPIVLSGEVAFDALAPAFGVATALAIAICGGLLWRGLVLNPILVGTDLWLALGAVAFGIPVAPLADLLTATQAFGLFVAAGLVGLGATFGAPTGYVGARGAPAVVRSTSYVLLAATALAIGWAWVFRADVRLGGGLPFIVLNVTRRVLIARAGGDR